MPKNIDHAQRRQEIAQTAWLLIRKNGVQGMTFRAVADELRRSTTVITRYFADRDALLEYVLDQVIAGWRLEFEQITANRPSEESVALITLWGLPFTNASRGTIRAYVSLTDCGVDNDGVRSRISRWENWLEAQTIDFIEAWVNEIQASVLLEPPMIGRLLTAITHGFAINSTHSPEAWNVHSEIAALKSFFSGLGLPIPRMILELRTDSPGHLFTQLPAVLGEPEIEIAE